MAKCFLNIVLDQIYHMKDLFCLYIPSVVLIIFNLFNHDMLSFEY